VGAAAEAIVSIHSVAGGELVELRTGIGIDPLHGPVPSVVVEVVLEQEVPEIGGGGVVGLDVGEVEQNAAMGLGRGLS